MINILSRETIEKIAAGEVADRPQSVIRELLDNAVDSGADSISAEIRGGGLTLIRVTDNGSGIEKNDIRNAFRRHATSKIKTAGDLTHVLTMGFRGEALSSIAAVSDTELVTRTADDIAGSYYHIKGGTEISLKEVGAPAGTTVAVRDFLYNVPVRREFLKSPQIENAYVVSMVQRTALANPDISLSLTVDGRSLLNTTGSGRLKDVIYIIYGAQTAKSLIHLDRTDRGIRIHGYIGRPVLGRSRRDHEIFIINKRPADSDILKKALEDAYSMYLMQRRFPFAVLNIELDPAASDVNVHPQKKEIRFTNSNAIYDVMYETVRDALSGKELIEDAVSDPGKGKFNKTIGSASLNNHIREAESRKEDRYFEGNNAAEGVPQYSEDKDHPTGILRDAASSAYSPQEGAASSGKTVRDSRPGKDNFRDFRAEPYEKTRKFEYVSSVESLIEAEYKPGGALSSSANLPDRNDEGAFISAAARPRYRLIGQVFKTYWIIEYNDEMYLIDQHAAHEKVNYERFVKRIKNHEVTSQMLYPPLIVTLTRAEAVFLDRSLELFAELGYEIDHAGDTDYIVRAVPSNLPDIGETKILKDLIGSIFEEGRGISSELLKDKIASMSCKAAVKGGSDLSEPEMRALLDELLKLENPYFCPHGRPTIIKWSKYELDKLFKRIV